MANAISFSRLLLLFMKLILHDYQYTANIKNFNSNQYPKIVAKMFTLRTDLNILIFYRYIFYLFYRYIIKVIK